MPARGFIYRVAFPQGYKKISAITQPGHIKGNKETTECGFGAVQLNLTSQILSDIINFNKYCINSTEDGVTDTPEQYKYPSV